MRKLEKAYMERTGTPSIQLMERAALAVARWAMELAGGPGRTAVFACGSGGNGGDGFAAARLYGQAGGRALVLPVYGEERLAPDAAVNCRLARTAPGVVFIAMEAVSYTHLDVYKRQPRARAARSTASPASWGLRRSACRAAPPPISSTRDWAMSWRLW